MDRDEFFEILRRGLMWETVCAHIERMNEADVILQKAGVENIAAECAEIQDTEDFFVMDVCESGGRIVIDFEMPFILCVNNTYHIEAMAAFLEEARAIRWFENSGRPNEKYDMFFSLYEACDEWGKRYTEVWKSHTYPLEDIALKKIGDDAIDDAFETVSAAIGDTVWEKFGEFIDRQRVGDELAVCDELFDRIRRDMAWACVEKILDMFGFFTMLAEIYKEGYFPCSWNGEYPSGRAVVL